MSGAAATSRGFTLLELLVVLLIFGIFAAVAYGGLDNVLNTRRRIEQSLARTAEYQKAYIMIRNDFIGGSSRTVRDNDGTALPAFFFDSYVKRVEFTRGGWSNPALLPRSTLERVSYFIDDSDSDNRKLVRRYWSVLDRAPMTQPIDLVLLEHVDSLQWRFLNKAMSWSDGWPPDNGTTTTTSSSLGSSSGGISSGVSSSGGSTSTGTTAGNLTPTAVEMTLRTRDWGDLRFLFRFGPDGLGTQG
jgi:general secretion pathway protein J